VKSKGLEPFEKGDRKRGQIYLTGNEESLMPKK
jgi:hypothetical protein